MDSKNVRFSFTQDDVNNYIELTGDDNKIHYDTEYCKKTIFKKPVIHGMLSASIFSKIFGSVDGAIYVEQNLKFLKPMFVNQEYVATVKIITKDKYSVYSTVVADINNNKCIVGTAKIKL